MAVGGAAVLGSASCLSPDCPIPATVPPPADAAVCLGCQSTGFKHWQCRHTAGLDSSQAVRRPLEKHKM